MWILKLHPFSIYSTYKHNAAVRKVHNSINYIHKHIQLLRDEEKKEIRDKILEFVFEEHQKIQKEEGVQCQIISYKAPEIKTYKAN